MEARIASTHIDTHTDTHPDTHTDTHTDTHSTRSLYTYLYVCIFSPLYQGDITACLLTNYMFDMDYVLAECPLLAALPELHLCIGEGDGAALRVSFVVRATCSVVRAT